MKKIFWLSLCLIAGLALVVWLRQDSGQWPGPENTSHLKQALAQLPIRAAKPGVKCRQHDPLRQAFYGDLHIHTTLSLDAKMQDTRTGPADAYRFARGEKLAIPPYDSDNRAIRYAQLARPLDFAAVTDHAEMLGEARLCSTPGLQGYNSLACIAFRLSPRWGGLLFMRNATQGKRLDFCGENNELCLTASLQPWQLIQDAAEQAQDYSDECSFSSFVGYEWTGGIYPNPKDRLVANLHRNVIFSNNRVPPLPATYIDTRPALALYQSLDQNCVAEQGCDAVVIPHNSNISMGLMFDPGETPDTATANLRARYETLVEMIQHKGASECYAGADGLVASDELCEFEQLPWDSFSGNTLPSLARPTNPGSGFMREVLRDGLRIEQQLGVNPFQLGFIGSTDTHRSLSGGVEEYDFQGHGGAGNAAVAGQQGLPDEWEFNPGGLAVLYAEENSRESLFAAMQRREAYATSGPRIGVRFFAGESLPQALCDSDEFLSQAYQHGVPMGGRLAIRESASSPSFVVSALKDPGTPARAGMDLQRVQIIKGWVDDRGKPMEQVYDIAGDRNNGASVNLANCEPQGSGFKQLCQVWQDPEFNPGQRAYYYARVLENPSCRWSTYVCNAQAVDCSSPQVLTDKEAQCCNADMPKTVQERAWTSPIWYSPKIQ